MGFLNVLCGPRASDLKVNDMEQYNFNPRHLLSQITTVMVRIWKQDEHNRGSHGSTNTFTVALATSPEYSKETMAKVFSVIQRTKLISAQFIEEVACFLEDVRVCVCVCVCVCV